jgi:hypothetical protein
VESTTLVPFWDVWETVRCFKRELLEDLRDRDTRLHWYALEAIDRGCARDVECHLADPDEFVGLQTQLPLWVCEAELEGKFGVAREVWTVHRL